MYFDLLLFSGFHTVENSYLLQKVEKYVILFLQVNRILNIENIILKEKNSIEILRIREGNSHDKF